MIGNDRLRDERKGIGLKKKDEMAQYARIIRV